MPFSMQRAWIGIQKDVFHVPHQEPGRRAPLLRGRPAGKMLLFLQHGGSRLTVNNP